jgi:hypothetical protein
MAVVLVTSDLLVGWPRARETRSIVGERGLHLEHERDAVAFNHSSRSSSMSADPSPEHGTPPDGG